MSKKAVIKSVSKKLKYYFEIKRKEDGFDTTGPDCPKLDHPPLKARPTLMYDGLHDRPLKHYFSPHEVRTMLTQMNPGEEPFAEEPEGKDARERKIKKSVERYMRQYQFVDRGKKGHENDKEKNPPLVDEYYTTTRKGGKKLKKNVQGYGVPLQKSRKPYKGVNPVLRTVPSASLTRGEATRLVNMATKLLVATETYELQGGKKKDKDDQYGGGGGGRGAPRSFESGSQNGLPAIDEKQKSKNKTQYDIHGRKIKSKKKQRKDDDDSAYSTRPGSASPSVYVSNIDGEEASNRQVKPWLRREMQKSDLSREDRGSENQWVRPHSASDAHTPRPPTEGRPHRPHSSKYRRDSESSEGSRTPPAQEKKAWGSENSVHSSEAAVQTGGELMRNYDVDERVVNYGEKTRYKIHVWTGNRLGSGTKADVQLVLIGANGRTELIPLAGSKKHKLPFQKGQEDIFFVDSYSVGTVNRIAIGHNRPETAYGWFLSRVHVKDTKKNLCYVFNGEKWLSGNDDGTGKTFREFPLTERVGYHDVPEDEADYTPSDGDVINLVRTDARPKTAEEVTVRDHSIDDDQATSSRTSVDTQPSSRSPRSPEPRADSPRRVSSSESDSESEPEPEPPKVEVTARPQTPPRAPSPPAPRQDDDFFDQRVKEKDYSSVIESLSTEMDNKDDFDGTTALGQVLEKHEGPARIVLRSSVAIPESEDSSADSDTDSEPDTARLGRDSPQRVNLRNQDTSDSDDDYEPRYESRMSSDDQEESSQTEKPAPIANVEPMQEKVVPDILVSGGSHAHDTRTLPSPPPPQPPALAPAPRMRAAGLPGSSSSSSGSPASSTSGSSTDSSSSDDEEQNQTTARSSTSHLEVPQARIPVAHKSDSDDDDDRPKGVTIHQMARNGYLDQMKDAISSHPELKTATDERGWTPLHVAAAQGHTEIVQWLSVSLLDLDVMTPTGYTAMHLASMNGHTGCMMVLSAMGAKVGCKSLDEQTPLHLAAAGGHIDNVKWLVANHADTKAKDRNGRNALALAEVYNQEDVVEFLRGASNDRTPVGQHLASPSTSGTSSTSSQNPYTSNTTSTPKVQPDSDSEDDDYQPPKSRQDRVKSAAPRRDKYKDSSDSDSDSATIVSSSDSETESEDETTKRKHDAEIMEKRKLYDAQQRKQSTQNISFLDSIRQEFD